MAIILLSSLSALAPVSGQTVTGSLSFQRGDDNTSSAVIDTLHGFAYFATDTCPGSIVKVRLSDFSRVGNLVFNQSFSTCFLSAAVIDPVNGFAYFGANSGLGQIVKVRLSDLTLVDSIRIGIFPIHVNHWRTAVIDTVNGFAYFGGSFFACGGLSPIFSSVTCRLNAVAKIRLSNFSLADPYGSILTVEPAPYQYSVGTLLGSAIDNSGFAYFSTTGTPSTIFKIRLSDFTLEKSLTVGQSLGATPLIDPTTDLGYWPTLTDPGSILRVRLSDLGLNGNLTLDPGQGFLNSGVMDAAKGFAYFATGNRPSQIIQVELSKFESKKTLTLAPYESLLSSSTAAIINTEASNGDIGATGGDNEASDGSFAYFGTYTSPSFVIKVKLQSMKRVATLRLQQGIEYFDSSVIDTRAGFVYFGTDNPFGTGSGTGAITRIRTSDFTKAGTLILNPGEGPICSAVIDTTNGFAYFATNTSPSMVVKIRLSDFSRVGALTLDTGDDFACTGVIDALNGFAYFGTFTSPSQVVKIRLSDFIRVGAVTLAPDEDFLAGSVIDVGSGFAYFAALRSYPLPGVISKVRLSDLTEVGSLTLKIGEQFLDYPVAAAIDPSGGFAYFGASGEFSDIVVRIRLSDFSENRSLALSTSEPVSAVLDVSHGFGYFASDVIVKVQLSTLTEVGSFSTYDPTTGLADYLTSASIDTAAGTAYFGVLSSPGKVDRVSL